METSITVETTIRNEANRLIAIFNTPGTQLMPEMVEGTLESLHAIAQELRLPIANGLKIRLVAVRNKLSVSQLLEVAA